MLGLANVSAYGFWSTTLAETLTYFPIVYLTLRPILAAIDPNLEEMAFSLGGSRWRIFRTVTLPLAVPGFANAFLLLFAASLADFATPLILAGNSFRCCRPRPTCRSPACSTSRAAPCCR